MTPNSQNQFGQKVILFQDPITSNGVGIAGLVISVLGIFLGWFPIFGWIVWGAGFVLSLIGVFKPKPVTAIAGLVISAFTGCFVILPFILSVLAAIFGLLFVF
ncbi:hypothetical protein [Echinicola shivajiensis]|uniref:hypothetical protein n=1 Tax=Echinicola shivajiensis TaxID=1035916 RepID=UPI001BFC90E3|nr:hypothetical protein [Echinicola shivajiensis]